jgi:hypothetical protein
MISVYLVIQKHRSINQETQEPVLIKEFIGTFKTYHDAYHFNLKYHDDMNHDGYWSDIKEIKVKNDFECGPIRIDLIQ